MKKIIPLFLLANLLVIIFFWWQTASLFIFKNPTEFILSIGRLSGLIAVYTILLQFLFMGRNPWLEGSFGLDRLAKLHRLNGYVALGTIILHALLISVGYAIQSKNNIFEQYWDFLTQYPDIPQAMLAVLLFITIVGSSIYIVRNKIKYEVWYMVHLLTYLAVLLAWGHQLRYGSDFAVNYPLVIYWYGLYIFVLGSQLLFRFINPLYMSWKQAYRVEKIVGESKDVNSVYVTGRNIDNLNVKAGQFFIIRFLTKKFWWQPHPFSVSGMPRDNSFRFSIKALGDFTNQVKDIQPGTKMLIEGPYGIFTKHRAKGEKVLCIAGGIGITPIRVVLEDLAKDGKDVVLLFSNKTRDDIVFGSEFDELEKLPNVKIIHYIALENGPTEPEGRLTQDKLKNLVPDVAEREIFLCGPPRMMAGTRIMLNNLGVKKENIYYEEFKF